MTAKRIDGRLAFLVPMKLGPDSGALAACWPDGKVSLHWQGSERWSYRLMPNPDGSHWGVRGRRRLYLLTPDGTFLPPMDVRPLFARLLGEEAKTRIEDATPVRITGKTTWMLVRDRFLAAVDSKTGDLLRSWPLPEPAKEQNASFTTDPFHVAAQGIFIHTGRRLYFIDWEGRRKDLGPA